MNNIFFTDTTKSVPNDFFPKPSSQFIPEWYKKMSSYVGEVKQTDGNGRANATIKKCMPVFDAITSGYIIVLPADLQVTQKAQHVHDPEKLSPYYEWASFGLIEFHSTEQAPTHPNKNGHETYPKFINPWSIKTPKGYSVLITQPFHRESPFTIMPGVVDTDTYTAPINFPFVLNDVTFEGLIPAGTPIAQVTPFKRDKWEMAIGSDKEFIEQMQVTTRLRVKFFEGYKTYFRQKKEYK